MAEKISNRTILMENGEVKKTLLNLAIPTIVATLISAIYNLVDTLFVGGLNNTAAMGAVSVAFPLFMIIAALGQMVGAGSASYISRCLGQKNKEQAEKTASSALFVSIILAIVNTVTILMFLEPILSVMGATDSIMVEALNYSRWLVAGSIFTIINMTLNNVVRAEGNSKFSMNALIIGAVLNIILDPIFMFVLNMGVKGAAVATVLGQAVSTVYLLQYYIKGKSLVKIKREYISRDKKVYEEIFKIGIPIFLMQFLASIAFSIQNSSASVYGDSAVAAIGIALRIYIIPIFVIIGFIQGFQPFVAYNYGSKNYDRVVKAIKVSIIWLTSFATVFFAIFQLKADIFVKLFTKDPEVLSLAINNVKALTLFMPFLGVIMVYTALFQSLGKGKQAFVLSVGRQGLFFIPALLILPTYFQNNIESLSIITKILPNNMEAGLYGIMFSQAFADCISVILTIILARGVNKELRHEKEYIHIKGGKYAENN